MKVYMTMEYFLRNFFWIISISAAGTAVFILATQFKEFSYSLITNASAIIVNIDSDVEREKCTLNYSKTHSLFDAAYRNSTSAYRVKYVLNPPTYLSEQDRKKINHAFGVLNFSKSTTTKTETLAVVSEIVQKQLRRLQNPEDCNTPHFICGHKAVCGLGCQIHQRIGCLILSYALGIPVIHDEKNWSYSEPWSDVFLPFGSKCSHGDETYRFDHNETDAIYRVINGRRVNEDEIEFPLKHGIPVLKELGELVDLSHSNPFLWWIGQFTKFGLQLNQQQQTKVETAMSVIGFHHSRSVIGIHVRRTDKNTGENPASRHNISDYVKRVDKYLNSLPGLPIREYKNLHSRQTVFVSSDDVNIINETRQSYSRIKNWNIIGFNGRVTYQTQTSRKAALQEIVVDLFLLSKCDFVVCGFFSNICGILLEMASYKHLDAEAHVDGTLDGKYNYNHYMAMNISNKIIKICAHQ